MSTGGEQHTATEAALEKLRALAASLQAKASPTDNDTVLLQAVLEALADHEKPAATA